MKDKKEIITEEGFALKFYPRETKAVSLNLSADVIDLLEKKAQERDMTLKALRQDLSKEEAKELALKRMKSRKTEVSEETDLAA